MLEPDRNLLQICATNPRNWSRKVEFISLARVQRVAEKQATGIVSPRLTSGFAHQLQICKALDRSMLINDC
jgi:hypothetical protein